MNAKHLKNQAEDMIRHCSNERTCKGCVGNEYINELKGNLCDIVGFSDNRHMTVDEVMQGLTEVIKNND